MIETEKQPKEGSALWERLNATLSPYVEKRLARFIKNKGCNKWIIGTDFCINEKTRPNDSFCFTIYPAENQFETSTKLLSQIGKDLKDVTRVPHSILRHLRGGKVFTICFVADRDRKLFDSKPLIKSTIDQTLLMMHAWQNADECGEFIARMKSFRQQLEKNSVSSKLVADIILTSTLISHIASLLAKHGDAQTVGWAPDRDSIISSFKRICDDFFAINVSALCERFGIPSPQLGIFTQANGDLWCDPFIRLPDYVAGAAAAWDPPKFAYVNSKKLVEVIRACADNPFLFWVRIAFISQGDQFACRMSRLNISKTRFNTKTDVLSLRGSSRGLKTGTLAIGNLDD